MAESNADLPTKHGAIMRGLAGQHIVESTEMKYGIWLRRTE
jgi:hypothetical protein